MNQMIRRALIGVGLGVLLYAAGAVYLDTQNVSEALSDYGWSAVWVALALSSANYLLRFAKWELCLGWLGIREPGEGNASDLTLGRSALIFIAGLSMSVTPGKVGEVLRSVLLRSSDGISGSRTAPIVVADRLTDLVALVILSLVGIAQYRDVLPVVFGVLVVVLAAIVVLGSPRLLHPVLGAIGRLGLSSVTQRAEKLVDSSAVLLRLRPLAVLTVLSVLGWGLECLGYYAIVRGFSEAEPSVLICLFLWSATTLIGAVSFLPGGLGATEGSLAILATRLVPGVSAPLAVASTLLIRACTLWFAVVIGGLSLAIFLRNPTVRSRQTGPPVLDSNEV
ncbi:flippase-like domain-containing protein [Myxococcota bacterium]|nr:flippase-like domain-containing protein [Myxococcota bacterium]